MSKLTNLQMDIFSSDLLMSLFSSAAHSYRQDSLVRPFPSYFLNSNNAKDFELLVSALGDIPPLHQINWKDTSKINKKSLDLIRWIISPKRFAMKKALPEKFQIIKELCGETGGSFTAKPDFLFEIQYNDQEEARFKRICGGRDIIYAYHGSRAENFHSILHNGLCNNLNKMSLFGEGIYLSSDLQVCQTYSPAGAGWSKSMFGTSLSCIAVCQVVDHPDVKCSVKRSSQFLNNLDKPENNDSQSHLRQRFSQDHETSSKIENCDASSKTEVKTTLTDRKRSFIQGSEGGKVPDKYYVVRNDDLVRIKYLLVYAPNAQRDLINQILSGNINKPKANGGAMRQFICRHKFFLVMLAYVLVLAFISLWNSKVFLKWWQNVIKGTEDDSAFLP